MVCPLLRIRGAAAWTMFIFGILAFFTGFLGLLFPEFLLRLLGFEILDRNVRSSGDYTLVFLIASSMASFNMGIYYILAALNNVRPFFVWTVPFRLVTFTVFTIVAFSGLAPLKFLGIALWEGVGALATGLALLYERRCG